MKLSRKRQREISNDAPTVRRLYNDACARWGKDVVDRRLIYIWDLRCMYGIMGDLHWESTKSRTMGELLWVAENCCGLGGHHR